jgi:hypothetical protein
MTTPSVDASESNVTLKSDEKSEMTDLMRAHLDAVTGGSSHSSWRSSPHQ